MSNNWKRLLAGVLASVVLVGAFTLTGGMKSGRRTDGLMYQASGLHPDGELVMVNGQIIRCEEYLYWLAQDCEYLAGQVEGLDWDAEITDGMTYGQYAKADALEAVKQHAVVRSWAEEAGVTLTDEDKAEMAAQREQYVSYYGSEEAFQRQLAIVGISEETLDATQRGQYLYRDLYQAFSTPGSSIYPDEKVLADYAAAQGYMGVYVITLTGERSAEDVAGDLLGRWQAAEDREAEYAAICQELEIEAGPAVTLAAVADDPLSAAIEALEIGEMDAVIDPYEDGTSFLVMRTEMDLSAVAQTYFDVLWNEKMESASVVINTKLYDAIDAGAFYEKLAQLRTELAAETGDANP